MKLISYLAATSYLAFIAIPATAANTTYSLSGNGAMSISSGVSGSSPYISGSSSLINGFTGDGTVSAFTVLNGDRISGTVTFSNSIVVPASFESTQILVTLGGSFTGLIQGTESFTLSRNGVDLPMLGFQNYGGSSGRFSVGAFRYTSASIVFDRIQFSINVSGLVNGPQSLSSIFVPSGLAEVSYVVRTPVPEPHTWALFVVGLAMLVRITTKESSLRT